MNKLHWLCKTLMMDGQTQYLYDLSHRVHEEIILAKQTLTMSQYSYGFIKKIYWLSKSLVKCGLSQYLYGHSVHVEITGSQQILFDGSMSKSLYGLCTLGMQNFDDQVNFYICIV
jgi:hypothetical protein